MRGMGMLRAGLYGQGGALCAGGGGSLVRCGGSIRRFLLLNAVMITRVSLSDWLAFQARIRPPLFLCPIGQNESGRLTLAEYCICKFNMENKICALRGSAT